MSSLSEILLGGLKDTLSMVFFSSLISLVIALPLSLFLYLARPNGLFKLPFLYQIFSFLTNVVRSLPFIILVFLLIPFTRLIVGRIIGTGAAIVPLSIAAGPFLARLFESNFLELDQGILEAALSMGISKTKLIFSVILPESLPSLIQSFTITVINIVSYSAMAGLIGGGGLGDIAYVYGYQRREYLIMLLSVLLIIGLVQIIQFIGQHIANRINKKLAN